MDGIMWFVFGVLFGLTVAALLAVSHSFFPLALLALVALQPFIE